MVTAFAQPASWVPHPGLMARPVGSLFAWATGPRICRLAFIGLMVSYSGGIYDATGKLCCTDLMVCIDPVVDYQKHTREVLLNALGGRISGLYVVDDQSVARNGLRG